MLNKLGPLIVLAGAAQSYFNKTKKGKELAKKAEEKRQKRDQELLKKKEELKKYE